MRSFSDRDKEILDSIMLQDKIQKSVVAELLKKYFEKNKLGLFLRPYTCEVFLLGKDSDTLHWGLSLIVDIISLFEVMEKSNYLYCLQLIGEKSPIFVSDTFLLNVATIDDNEYRVSNGSLKIEGTSIKYIDLKGRTILEGCNIGQNISNKIIYYLTSLVYPSDALFKYKKDNYESFEVLSYKEQISEAKLSRNIAWIALLISLLSPFVMTFFNNKYAKTEINEWQFDSLLYQISDISNNAHAISEKIILNKNFMNDCSVHGE